MLKPHIELKKPRIVGPIEVKVTGSVASPLVGGVALRVATTGARASVSPQTIRGTTGQFEVSVLFPRPGAPPVPVVVSALGGGSNATATATFEARLPPKLGDFEARPIVVHMVGLQQLELVLPLTHTFDQRLEFNVGQKVAGQGFGDFGLLRVPSTLVAPAGARAVGLRLAGRKQGGYKRTKDIELHIPDQRLGRAPVVIVKYHWA
jgi:hypothetical protein